MLLHVRHHTHYHYHSQVVLAQHMAHLRPGAHLPGQTLLDGLIAIGVEPTFSCQQGICGTCEVKVLEGTQGMGVVLAETQHNSTLRFFNGIKATEGPHQCCDNQY